MTLARYRADVDGLRAVAVLVVVAYHASPRWVPGGYVGVDVFFVISGFVIAGVLLDEAEATGRVRPLAFYQRRVLRILPALLTVLVAVCVAAWCLLPRVTVRALGVHVAGAAGFVSNFVLWREAGYFDLAAQEKPLLHLWSLAVEEQFYLFAPLLALGVVRGVGEGRRRALAVVVLTLASFALCARMGSAPLAFYAAPCRAWEIGCGALVAGAVRAGIAARSPRRLQDAAAVLGLALIGGACAIFDGGISFPVAANVVPVLGACLCVASPAAALNRRVLARPGLVFLGKVSYPLYLWHWPLLSFATLLGDAPPGLALAAAIVVASLALAVATQRWIEAPIRASTERRRNTLALVLVLIVVGALGVVLADPRPAPAATAAKSGETLESTWDPQDPSCMSSVGLGGIPEPENTVFCSMKGAPEEIEALVLGDSSANSLYTGIGELLTARGVASANVGMVACAPARGVDGLIDGNRACKALNEQAYAFALHHPRVRWALLGFTPWDFRRMSFPGVDRRADERARFEAAALRLADDVAALRRTGMTVVVSVDVPYLDSAIDRCRDARERGAGGPDAQRACRSPVDRLQLRTPYLGWWREALARLDVCVFDQTDALVEGGDVLIADAGGLLFRDSHHLTRHGSRRVAASLLASRCSPAP